MSFELREAGRRPPAATKVPLILLAQSTCLEGCRAVSGIARAVDEYPIQDTLRSVMTGIQVR
jgi:hypothetical protein